jgi:flagellar biosynthetic protein FlhB
MWSEDADERTESPTLRRRTEARREGYVPRSAEFASALALLGATLALPYVGSPLVDACGDVFHRSLRGPAALAIDSASATSLLADAAAVVGAGVAGVLAVLFCCAVFAQVAPSGISWTPNVLRPNWSRISPQDGARRWVSKLRDIACGTAVLKTIAIAGLVSWRINADWQVLESLRAAPISSAASVMGRWLLELAVQISAALLALSVLDVVYQRWRHERSLRMTRQQVTEEQRMLQADPGVRARQRETARRIMALHRGTPRSQSCGTASRLM